MTDTASRHVPADVRDGNPGTDSIIKTLVMLSGWFHLLPPKKSPLTHFPQQRTGKQPR